AKAERFSKASGIRVGPDAFFFGEERMRLALAALVVVAAFSDVAAEPIGVKAREADNRLERAVGLLEQGKVKDADTLFAQILEDDPAQLNAALGRASIAMAQKRIADADRAIDGVLSKQ